MHDAPHVSHAMDEEWARTYYVFFFFFFLIRLWRFFITQWWCQIHTDAAILCLNFCWWWRYERDGNILVLHASFSCISVMELKLWKYGTQLTSSIHSSRFIFKMHRHFIWDIILILYLCLNGVLSSGVKNLDQKRQY